MVTVLLGVLARTVVAARGWFYWDDLILASKARASTLPELLFQPHDGHLMPAAWVIEWLLARDPLNWPAAVATLALLQLAAGAAVAYACHVFAGRQAWIPTALYLLTPLTLPVTTWLAAAVNALPMHAAIALVAVAAYQRAPRAAASWFVVGLLFNERMLFVAVFAIVALVGYRRSPLRRVALAVLVPAALWAVLYLVVVDKPVDAGGMSWWALAWHGYVEALIPTAAGGPWSWERWHPAPPWAAPSWVAILAGLAVIAAVAWWSRKRLAVWIPTLVYPLLPITALAVGRASDDTAYEIVLTLRHLSEVAVIVALTVAYLARSLPLPRIPVVAYAASAAISTVAFANVWADQPARDYFTQLQAELAGHDEPLLDQQVPLDVLLPVAHPHNLLSHQLPGAVAASTTAPVRVDARGALQQVEMIAQRSTELGGDTHCFTGQATLPLDGPLLDVTWVVLLNYYVDETATASPASPASPAATATVSLSGEAVEVPLAPGLNQTYIQLSGGGDQLHLTTDREICVGVSDIGVLSPAGTTGSTDSTP